MEFYLGAAFAIGFAGLGVGIGEGLVAKKSMEVMGKNPDMTSTFLVLTILGIALVESAAIYGLIVSLKIVGTDPATIIIGSKGVAAGLAIGLPGFAAGLGEGMLVSSAMDSILRNPEGKGKIMTFMILFIALVESVAIYGLVIALQLLG